MITQDRINITCGTPPHTRRTVVNLSKKRIEVWIETYKTKHYNIKKKQKRTQFQHKEENKRQSKETKTIQGGYPPYLPSDELLLQFLNKKEQPTDKDRKRELVWVSGVRLSTKVRGRKKKNMRVSVRMVLKVLRGQAVVKKSLDSGSRSREGKKGSDPP